jgi:hypothetical protein
MSTLNVTNLAGPSNTGTAAVLSSINGGAISGSRNRIINGDMRIDQRNAGASLPIPNNTIGYPVDRWYVFENGTMAFSGQRSTTAPAGFTNSLLVTTTTQATAAAGDRAQLSQKIEGFNASDLGFGTASAQAITLSFAVRSSLTGTFGGSIQNDAEDRSYPFAYAISSADTWEIKTVTIPGDTTGTWVTDNGTGMRVNFDLGMGSTLLGSAGAWAAADYRGATGGVKLSGTDGATLYITGVQLEAGSVATPFERRNYGQELALCQRYYTKVFGRVGVGDCASTTSMLNLTPFPVTMRTAPSAVEINGVAGDYSVRHSGISTVCSAVPSFSVADMNSAQTTFTVASGFTLGRAARAVAGSSPSGAYLAWSAEL